ncbi:MAG: ABC transporter ATP-binding protein [Kiritimatiellia bacterium]|jgi:ABC-2 type transport system ATP-binding protein|nr:ABC transporter ATP-binding protein [Kiritimatiellia bacterium]MDP6848658.1 ABC transporter ATP-binding protein [Kiritimatiellia bacterium]
MIAINNLVKKFGDFTAVDNLCLDVPEGELFCFLGPNGAGKTTTIKMLTGLLKPTSGSAMLNGMDIQCHPVEVKKLLGYIPDMPYLYDRLTTTEFFKFTGDLYSIPDGKVAEELERSFDLFGLIEHRTALIKDLSHGLRQRLIYASTFLHDPKILFIDEPLIGLDPYTIRLIKRLLIRKARNGTTIFLTTHILPVAEDIADRIGIIADGRIVALGKNEELMSLHGADNLEDVFLKLTGKDPDDCLDSLP